MMTDLLAMQCFCNSFCHLFGGSADKSDVSENVAVVDDSAVNVLSDLLQSARIAGD